MTTPPIRDPASCLAEATAFSSLSEAVRADTLEEGARMLLLELQGALGISGGLVAIREGRTGQVLAARGVPENWAATWERELPEGIDARLRPGLIHEPLDFPDRLIDAELKRHGIGAVWTLPFGPSGSPSGALVLVSSQKGFNEAARGTLEAVARAFGCWVEVRLRERVDDTSAKPTRRDDYSRRFEESWGSLPVGTVSSEGIVQEMSDDLGALLRVKPGEIKGRRIENALASVDVPRLRASLARVESEGAVALPSLRADTGPDVEADHRGFDLVFVAREDAILTIGIPPAHPVGSDAGAGLDAALLSQPDLGVVRTNAQGKILAWSPSATRILGWQEFQVLGRSVDFLLHSSDRPHLEQWLEQREQAATGEREFNLQSEEHAAHPCGVRPLFLADSLEVVFVIRSRRSEDANERWLRWSRSLISVLGVSAVVLDPGGRIRELGVGWVGGDQKQLPRRLGRHVAELFDSDRSEILAALRSCARDGEWTGSLVASGLPVNVRFRVVRDDDGRIEALVGARLPDTLGDARDLVRKIPAGMILVDPEFRIVETNRELVTICGEDSLPAEMLGLDVRELAMFQTSEIEAAWERLPEEKGFDLREVGLKETSEPTTVRFRATTLTTDQGSVTGYLLMLLARSGVAQLDRRLLRKHKMESIGNLTSGLAHDFCSFVSVVLGKASLLRSKLPEEPGLIEELDGVEAAAKRAQHLAQELMHFARSGPRPNARLELSKLIEDVSALIRTSVGKRIEVEFRLGENLDTVDGDEVEIQQLVLNLCLNARDAMPEGGRLVIETRAATEAQRARLATGSEATGGISLIVRDTGTGLEPDVSDRIFEPFFTTKGDPKGTGLGLAMVYGTVQRHGGTIDVRSEPGEGTTFEIALPGSANEIQEEPASRRILVADDEPAFREMFRLILEKDGHRTSLACDGKEALEILRTDHQDLSLVILDLRMPEVDGLGVLEELQELAPKLPVLVTTGYASAKEKELAMSRGARKILEKPYRVNDLRNALAEVLRGAERAAHEDAVGPAGA